MTVRLSVAIAPAYVGFAGSTACALGRRSEWAGTGPWDNPGTVLSFLPEAGVVAGETLSLYNPTRGAVSEFAVGRLAMRSRRSTRASTSARTFLS